MRRLLLVAAVAGMVLLALALAGLFFADRAARHEPEFYRTALAAPPTVQSEAGEELERRVLDLANDVRQEGAWEAVFTAEQINGWLAADLPRKFPQGLPAGMQAPRVALEPGRLLAACRLQDGQLASVLWFEAEVALTDEPNVLAIRIRDARAGLLPLPLSRFLDQATAAAAENDVTLRWTEESGDPVALLTLPLDREPGYENVVVERIELQAGELRLAGRNAPQVADGFAPPPGDAPLQVTRQP